MTSEKMGSAAGIGKAPEFYGKWSAVIDGVELRITRKLNITNEFVAKTPLLPRLLGPLKPTRHSAPTATKAPRAVGLSNLVCGEKLGFFGESGGNGMRSC
jgi:hypothetical protein